MLRRHIGVPAWAFDNLFFSPVEINPSIASFPRAYLNNPPCSLHGVGLHTYPAERSAHAHLTGQGKKVNAKK